MTRRFFLVLLILFPVPARADVGAVPSVLETIHAKDIAHDVEILSGDDYEGREPGTPGEEKTLRYLEQAFRDAGALPGTANGYLQPVPLAEVRRAGTPRFRLSDARGRLDFAFEKEFVTRAGRPLDAAKLERLPVVFAGYGVTAPEESWNDYAGGRVEGAAVLLLRGEPNVSGDSTRFMGRALTPHALPGEKYPNAARHGARAAIVIHTDASAGYPWSIMSGGGLGSAQNFLADDDPAEPQLELVVHVSEPAARRMLTRAGLDLDSLVAQANRPGFHTQATSLAADMEFKATQRTITSHNVIARIPGREAPDECVIYTAHWDHVGRNDALPGDKIFNGAVDNATGTAGVLALARAFAALPQAPRRTVYFVATTAEERGLLGSEYLARHPVQPLSSTVGVLNMDAHFPYGPFNAMTVPALGSSELEDILAVAAKRTGRVLQDDSAPEAGAYYRADHYSFARRGVPALFAVGGPRNEDLTETNPVTKRFADYMANGYHKPGDEYDAATWDMAGIEEDVRCYFETGWRLAEDTRFPNWRYGNPFRALRDGMRKP